jgi:tellurium resistance protein TerD
MKLEKNQTINLTKDDDKLIRVKAVLNWQTPANIFPTYDLDVSCFLLNENAKLISDEGFIFYNNETAPDNSVWKSPDERAGGSEEIGIDISKLSPLVSEISIIVTIHKGIERNQNFGGVTGANIEIFNADTSEKIAYFELDKDMKTNTACQVGSFCKTSEGFTFKGVSIGYNLDLQAFLDGYSA